MLVAPIVTLPVALCACLCLLCGGAPPANAASSASIFSAASGSPVVLPTGSDPQGIAFDARFDDTLGVADEAIDAVSGLGVDSATGSLGDVGEVSTPAEVDEPRLLAGDPTDDLVAVGADEGGTGVISLYEQDATGALTYVTSTSAGLDGDLTGLAWSPDGSELVACSEDRVITFSVEADELSVMSWQTSGEEFVGVAVGEHTVAAIDRTKKELVTWNNADGGLAEEQTTPVEGSDTPSAIAFRPDAGDAGSDVFAVAENYQDNDKLVQWETVAGNAGEADMGGVSAIDGEATALSFDADGGMVAALEGGDALALYALGSGPQGTTTEVPGSPIEAEGATFASVALDADGTAAAVTESGGSDGDAVEVWDIAQPTVTFTASPGQSVTQGTKLTVNFTCQVPDGTTLTYCLDSNGNEVATPSTATLGDHTVEVTATDDIGQSTTASYTYTVVAAETTTGTTDTTTTTSAASGTWFGIKKAKRYPRSGVSRLGIRFHTAGRVTITGAGVKPVSRKVTAGLHYIALHPKGSLATTLARRGWGSTKVTVTFTPTGDTAITEQHEVAFRLAR
ncbi:MAG: hypothetical protein QM729_05895 [Solirubrobacterales bacterium]